MSVYQLNIHLKASPHWLGRLPRFAPLLDQPSLARTPYNLQEQCFLGKNLAMQCNLNQREVTYQVCKAGWAFSDSDLSGQLVIILFQDALIFSKLSFVLEYQMECCMVYFTSSIKTSAIFREIEKASEVLCNHFSQIPPESLFAGYVQNCLVICYHELLPFSTILAASPPHFSLLYQFLLLTANRIHLFSGATVVVVVWALKVNDHPRISIDTSMNNRSPSTKQIIPMKSLFWAEDIQRDIWEKYGGEFALE